MISSEFENEFNKAIHLRDEGSLDAAAEILLSLSTRFPDRTVLYIFMGDIYWDLKKTDDAIACFQKAVQLKPTSETASLGLFHTLWESDKLNDAFNEVRRFLTFNNDFKKTKKYRELLSDIIKELGIEEQFSEGMSTYPISLK